MMSALDDSTRTDTSPNQQTLLQYTYTGGRSLRSCYHAVLPEYTPVRKHTEQKLCHSRLLL